MFPVTLPYPNPRNEGNRRAVTQISAHALSRQSGSFLPTVRLHTIQYSPVSRRADHRGFEACGVGERLMALLCSLYAKPHEAKSGVARLFCRWLLGLRFWMAPKGEIKCRQSTAEPVVSPVMSRAPRLWVKKDQSQLKETMTRLRKSMRK